MQAVVHVIPVLIVLSFSEPFIKIEELPDHLVLPVRAGSNEFLRVSVGGGSAQEVWLGSDSAKSRRVPMTQSGEARYEINLEDPNIEELLSRNDEVHHLRVFAEMKDGRVISSAMISVRRKFKRLKLLSGEAKFTVMQHSAAELPSSNESLHLCLEDITGGQVKVRVMDSNWKPVTKTTLVRPGDRVALEVDDEEYAVGCRKLVNQLIGHDYGIFILCRPKRWERIRIDILLERIENSTAVFVQDDQELSGSQFVAILKARMKGSEQKVETYDAFMTLVAARPDKPKQPYRVKLGDSTPWELTAWLQMGPDAETSSRPEAATTRASEKP